MRQIAGLLPFVLIPLAALGLLTGSLTVIGQEKKLPPAERIPEEPAELPGNPVLRPFTYDGPAAPAYLPFKRTEWPSGKTEEFQFRAPGVGQDKGLPINLPAALRLVNARSLDIAIAVQQVEKARAQHDFAKFVWLPTVALGPQYYRHGGIIQNASGQIFNTPVSQLNAGVGVYAIFSPSDAILGALSARQAFRSSQADLTTTIHDTTLAVATAYFNAQQARGDLFAAQDTVAQADRLVQLTEKLANVGGKGKEGGLVLPLEVSRARAERARRLQSMRSALENWRVNSAELIRILRMEPSTLVEPEEAPHMQVSLINLSRPVDDFIPIGLRNRPELASQQALVEAALLRLKAEKIRPLVPSVVISGTGPSGSTASIYGGGQNAIDSPYQGRADVGVQLLWPLQGLGLQNLSLIRQRGADQRAAVLALLRAQDKVAAEVIQAHARARSADQRLHDAESGLKDALDSLDKNFQGLRQTKRVGETLVMIVRPQEVVAALQALAQAYSDYYGAVADFNRYQFLLFRDLGYPTQLVGNDLASLPAPGKGHSHHSD